MRRTPRLVALTSMAVLSVQGPGTAQSPDPRFELGLRGAMGHYWTVCESTLRPVVGVEASWRAGWTATAIAELAFLEGRASCGALVFGTDPLSGLQTMEVYRTPRFPRGIRLGLGFGPELRIPAGALSPSLRLGVTWIGYELEDEGLETLAVPWVAGVLGFRPVGWRVGVELEAGVHRLRSRRDRWYMNAVGQRIDEETGYFDERLDPFVRLAIRWRWRPWM